MASITLDMITPEVEARFWDKVDKRGTNDCWHWTGGSNGVGYGKMWVKSRMHMASHVALAVSGLPRLNKNHAMHSCDNPPCCNPAHLKWGTREENMADMAAKGRANPGDTHWSRVKNGLVPRGDTHCHAKLTTDDVVAIRRHQERHGLCRFLADTYGVSHSVISEIRARKSWRHVP